MSDKKIRFANQYSNHPLGDTPLKCNILDNKVLQEYKDECDINYIIKQYSEGVIDKLPVIRQNRYGDEVSLPKTFEECQNFIETVKNDFNTLPADIKKQFGNDVNRYVAEFGQVFTNDKISKKFSDLGIFNSKIAECNPASPESSLLTRRGDSNTDDNLANVTNIVQNQEGVNVNGANKV